MQPAVLALYTLPIAASPLPREVSTWVANGNVMPAQKAVGNITIIDAASQPTVMRT